MGGFSQVPVRQQQAGMEQSCASMSARPLVAHHVCSVHAASRLMGISCEEGWLELSS